MIQDSSKRFFNCHQCGRCCNSGPALSIDECFRFQDVFIIGLRYQTQIVYSDPKVWPIPPSIIDEMSTVERDSWKADFKMWQEGLFPKFTNATGDHFVNIYPIDVGYSSDPGHNCPALMQDGRCSLHAQKPSMCKSVPLDPAFPEYQQIFILDKFKKYDCIKEHGDESELVFANGCVIDESLKSGFQSRTESIQLDTKYMSMIAHMIKDGGNPMVPDIGSIINNGRTGNYTEGTMLPLLFLMKTEDDSSVDRIRGFIDSQKALIKSEVEKAIQRKSKSERDRTAQLRTMLAFYDAFGDTF